MKRATYDTQRFLKNSTKFQFHDFHRCDADGSFKSQRFPLSFLYRFVGFRIEVTPVRSQKHPMRSEQEIPFSYSYTKDTNHDSPGVCHACLALRKSLVKIVPVGCQCAVIRKPATKRPGKRGMVGGENGIQLLAQVKRIYTHTHAPI
jgi:hypothetical protein